MVAGLGIEPKFSLSESDVLPLDDPAIWRGPRQRTVGRAAMSIEITISDGKDKAGDRICIMISTIPRDEFEKMAADAYDRLPGWIQARIMNVALIVEDVVPEDLVRDMKLDSDMDLLGLYTGISLVDRSYDAPFAMPDTIHIYKLPIEEEAEMSGKPVADVLYETIWHEVAHHFGLDEDAVQKREGEEFGR